LGRCKGIYFRSDALHNRPRTIRRGSLRRIGFVFFSRPKALQSEAKRCMALQSAALTADVMHLTLTAAMSTA
jgi:hypothetical protein